MLGSGVFGILFAEKKNVCRKSQAVNMFSLKGDLSHKIPARAESSDADFQERPGFVCFFLTRV